MTTTESIRGIHLWDGSAYRGTSRIDWTGDRIDAVQSDEGTLDELCVIPGLVDTHVHLGAYSGTGHADWSSWPLITPWEEQVFHIANNAQKAARAGVTTLRDLSGDERQLAVKRAFDEGIQPGPRVLVHGAVGMTAGHGDLFIPPHYPHRGRTADSPDECRKLVREYARMGADGIKIFVSGGVLSMGDKVGWRNQTLDEIRATIDEAHALSMPVAAHSHSAEGNEIALSVGADSLEHGTGLEADQWERLVAGNIPVAPTLLINDAIADGRVAVTDDAREKAKDVVAYRDSLFGDAGRAGIRFVLGTDANGIFVQFGDQMEEVRLMADMFGWDAERALRAATSDAADVVGLTKRVGTLAEGYGADFVVLRGRPWENIADLRVENIVAVVSRGRLVHGALPTAA
ncbi:amidohydrolase family protein [Microbacterium esteraromaticum]|uniref:metal-dependent hydrolase family protein n=1 Tax=Microbacterium esteraromaticum TaxID=57043 RepID=UPI001CD3AE49|nr:amidohydrolase family protein [Microbacterium esteraromaticum]MCA1307334.1 amidohydrolase family protein [Microbacterium esteraromaticum]